MSYCTLSEAIDGDGCPTCTAELDALRELAHQAERYHVDCGHDLEGAAAQCDAICEAWKAWRALLASDKRGGT